MIYGLPERLKEQREKYGMSQNTIAKRLNIAPATVSGYERGERTPSPLILLKLSYIYNCSVDYLLGKNNDDGSHVYIDVTELSEKQRKAVNDLVNAIKE
ncbi:MAG: helix-turn-helix domain-containing protein [Oscillospiraceae bacterium]|nr:helix-turn-helix domain-containing protein [Oscillospiraceae bacterium]